MLLRAYIVAKHKIWFWVWGFSFSRFSLIAPSYIHQQIKQSIYGQHRKGFIVIYSMGVLHSLMMHMHTNIGNHNLECLTFVNGECKFNKILIYISWNRCLGGILLNSIVIVYRLMQKEIDSKRNYLEMELFELSNGFTAIYKLWALFRNHLSISHLNYRVTLWGSFDQNWDIVHNY
jgi:hypothetical protein